MGGLADFMDYVFEVDILVFLFLGLCFLGILLWDEGEILMDLIYWVVMIKFKPISYLNNLVKYGFIQLKSTGTIFSQPIKLYPNQLLQRLPNIIIMIKLINNLRDNPYLLFLLPYRHHNFL